MKQMFVRLVDVETPRTDGQKGGPRGVTLGNMYVVAEILDETGQYSIINDDMKIARYSQSRFEVVGSQTFVNDLRSNFNHLTLPMRVRIKELEVEVAMLKGGQYS